MQIAAVYDIHGNLPALEAVLREVHDVGVDLIVVGGDVVPGPMPRETLECLMQMDTPTQFIQGNGESDVLADATGVELSHVPPPFRELLRWSRAQLAADQIRTLASWPAVVQLELPSVGAILFCHATPRNNREIFTVRTSPERLLPIFEDVGASLVICGHTHMQFDRMVGKVRVVNSGSVGMPFGKPGAYWLLLGQDVQLRCTPYDYVEAARRIRDTEYPQALEFANHNVLTPPSESDMLEQFFKAELR